MLGESLTAASKPSRRGRGRDYWFALIFGRLLPAIVFSVFVVGKLVQVAAALPVAVAHPTSGPALLDGATQLLALAYFILLVVLFVVRLPRRGGDGAASIIAISFFGSFSILAVTRLPGVPARTWLLLPADLLLVFGLAYSLWALGYLRRSFSIMPEARRLVTGGPYRLSRHPLYFGEAIAGLAISAPSVGWPGAILIGLFLLAQYLRIRAEERVLAAEFPQEYAAYRLQTPRYLPDLRKLLP